MPMPVPMPMAVYSKSLILLLATTWLAQALQPLAEQQRLNQAEPQGPGTLGDAAFDEFVLQAIHAYHVPGLSLAVIDNGQISAQGYGIANFPGTPATPDTLYFTGSTTKAFTAAAAGLLIQDQDHYPGLKWTSPINHFLREDFVLQDDHATSHTTIEDALSHRSGLPRHDLSWGEPGGTPSSLVKKLRHLPMTAEPRTRFQYCNILYGVVTDLLETLTGLRLETILHEKFWGPLGMASTSFGGPISESRLARGYYWNPEQDDSSTTMGISPSKSQYFPEVYWNLSDASGAGATISSVNDYALWVKALLDTANATKPGNASSPINCALYRDILTPRMIVQSLDPHWTDFLTPQLYALGWVIISINGHTIVGHGGSLPGFGTNVFFLPDDGYGIVTMGNTEGTSNLVGNIIASVLLKRKLGLSTEETASAENSLSAAFSDSQVHQGRHHHHDGENDGVSVLRSRDPDPLPPDSPPTTAANLPLPGAISDFAGMYTHPAYGMINFTISTSSETTCSGRSSSSFLYGLPTLTRLLNYALELHHVTDTLFTARLMLQHGLDPEVVWEHVISSRAVFKFGLSGEAVETLGIELEEEMVQAARRKGGKFWKEGMIWFEKM